MKCTTSVLRGAVSLYFEHVRGARVWYSRPDREQDEIIDSFTADVRAARVTSK